MVLVEVRKVLNFFVASTAFWALMHLALLFLPAPTWVQRDGWLLSLGLATVIASFWWTQQEPSYK